MTPAPTAEAVAEPLTSPINRKLGDAGAPPAPFAYTVFSASEPPALPAGWNPDVPPLLDWGTAAVDFRCASPSPCLNGCASELTTRLVPTFAVAAVALAINFCLEFADSGDVAALWQAIETGYGPDSDLNEEARRDLQHLYGMVRGAYEKMTAAGLIAQPWMRSAPVRLVFFANMGVRYPLAVQDGRPIFTVRPLCGARGCDALDCER